MKRHGLRVILSSLFIFCLLAIASIGALAQTPAHPPAAGEIQFAPPMFPITPLPYSWELGKDRTQHFGDFRRGKPSKEVRKLLKMKADEQKQKSKNP